MSEEQLKDYVESKILSYTFHAKNFSKEDMDRVDNYCKSYFGNDRKKMILTLITMVENNAQYEVLNDKINLLSIQIFNEIDEIKNKVSIDETEEKPKKRVSWKGLKNDANI